MSLFEGENKIPEAYILPQFFFFKFPLFLKSIGMNNFTNIRTLKYVNDLKTTMCLPVWKCLRSMRQQLLPLKLTKWGEGKLCKIAFWLASHRRTNFLKKSIETNQSPVPQNFSLSQQQCLSPSSIPPGWYLMHSPNI